MEDGGVDEKVICVPATDSRWDHIQDLSDAVYANYNYEQYGFWSA